MQKLRTQNNRLACRIIVNKNLLRFLCNCSVFKKFLFELKKFLLEKTGKFSFKIQTFFALILKNQFVTDCKFIFKEIAVVKLSVLKFVKNN